MATIEQEFKQRYDSVLAFPEAECNQIKGVTQGQHLARLALHIAHAREAESKR
jgi:hypothetical protein